MHNPFRSYRLLVSGLLAVALGAGWAPAHPQTAAARQNETALSAANAEVPAGPQGRRYTQTFTASGGVAPYVFEVTGSVPAGMRWIQAENGLLLDGVPQVIGDFPLTVKVSDGTGETSTHDYVLHVTPADTGSSANIPVAEAVGVADVPAVFFPVAINVTEGVSVADAPAVFFPVMINVAEGVSVADAPVIFYPVMISVSEGVSVADAPVFSGPIQITVSEGVAVADDPELFSPLQINVAEGVAVADDPELFSPLQIQVTESVAVADDPELGVPVAINVAEGVSVTDTVSFGAAPVMVTLNEPIAVTDTVSFGAAPVMVTLVEPIMVTDTVSFGAAPVMVTLVEPIMVTDMVSSASAIQVNLAEPISVTDSVSATPVQAAQTITIGTLPTPVYGGAPFSVSATATSGLPVTIQYVSGPATGSGSGPYTATGAGTVYFTATQAGNGSYAAATPVNFSVNISQASQTINLGTLPTPVYGGAPFSVSATSTSGLPVTIQYVSGPATGSGAGPYTATGAGTVYFTATQAGNGSYAAATPVNFSVNIAQASQTINLGTLPTPVYGGAPFSVSATSTSGLPVTIQYVSGPATGSGAGPYTATGAGTVNFTATQAGNTNYAAATAVNFSVVVGKQASVTAVSASPSSITPVQTVTLTATVSAAVTGTPMGMVTFYDNNVPLGSPVQLAGGQAQLTTLLLSGPQVISATYSGDGNFLTSASTANATVSVAPLDFTLAPVSPVSLNVVPGASVGLTFNVTPLYLVYPAPVTFSVTGLPSSATYTVTPASIAVNGGPQTVTVTIKTAPATGKNVMPFGTRSAPVALALLVPLFALGALRRRRRWMAALMLAAGVFAGSALTGCGSNRTGNGFFGQSPQTYPVVITATSGAVQHTINVTLQIQ